MENCIKLNSKYNWKNFNVDKQLVWLASIFKQVFYTNFCKVKSSFLFLLLSQPAFTCLKLTIETLDQGAKYVQSQQ